MARFLALDWDSQQLRIVAATVRAGQVQLEQVAHWSEEKTPNLAEAEALGHRLRDHLKQAGIAPAPLLACVSRDRVILHEVRYPAVSKAEEAGVVRFQVLKELTDAAQDVIIDYLRLGETSPGEEQRALVLTVRRELLAAYQALAKAAGVKLLALTPRPFGTLACLHECLKNDPSSELAKGSAVAVLTVAEHWAEFCVVRGDTLLVARSLPAGPTLAAEVRRNLAVFGAQSPRQAISRIYVAGNGENTSLRDTLQQTLALPVSPFDPLGDGMLPPSQERGAFAGPVGLLRAYATGRPLLINFVAPKQAEVARDPNRRRLALVGGLAAALFLGVGSYCYAQLHGRARELADLQAENLVLDKQMPLLDEEANRFDALNEWCRGNICWLDELYNLTAYLPNLNTLRLAEVHGEVPLLSKDKEVARLTLKVLTTGDEVSWQRLISHMGMDKHYTISPRDPAPDVKDPPFRKQYTVKVGLQKQTPEQYAALFTPPPTPQPVKGGRRGASAENLHVDVNAPGIAKPEKGDQIRHVGLPVGRGPVRGGMAAREAVLQNQSHAAPIGAAPVDLNQKIRMAVEAGGAPPPPETTNPAVEAARKRVEDARSRRGIPPPNVVPASVEKRKAP